MMHGDDDGLRVPPRLAQIQAVVLAIKGERRFWPRSASWATG